MRSCFRAAVVLLPVLAGMAACKGTPQVSFDVSIPSGLVTDTAWFEIGAFRGATCAALRPMLADGIPDGASARVSFKKSDRDTPKVGDLPNDDFAFAAVARKEDCSVIATGCVEANVGSTKAISVPLSPTDGPTGACPSGATCQAGRCVPANDNADPSVGAGCSLELVGAGPLPRFSENGSESASPAGMQMSAPAIAATPSGFLIAYRQIDAAGGLAKLILLPVDPSGGSLPPLRSRLKRCGSVQETDGVALAMNGADGLVGLARAPCDNGSALELLNVTVKDDGVTLGKFFSTNTVSGGPLALSPSKAGAWRGGNGVIAYVEAGQAQVSTMFTEGINAPTGSFGGSTKLGSSMTGAWVVATDAMLAMLAAGSGPAGPSGGASDAGASGDAGTGANLRLVLAKPPGIDLSGVNGETAAPVPPIVFAGNWGSLAAVGKRAIVLSDSGGPGRSATYRAYDLGSTQPADTNGISVEGLGKATAGDVAMQGDRVYFAILKQGAISLAVYANATTTPSPLRQTSFANEPRIPSVSNVRDGRVAVAATDKRVAVAWTTAATLGQNDTNGGYAVFACTP